MNVGCQWTVNFFSLKLAVNAVGNDAYCTHLLLVIINYVKCRIDLQFDIRFCVTLCRVEGSNAKLQMIYKYFLLNGLMKCCDLGYCAYNSILFR